MTKTIYYGSGKEDKERLDEIAQALLEAPRMTSEFHPKDNSEFWIIPKVNYRSKTENYELSRKLLPAQTQDQFALSYDAAVLNNQFHSLDMILMHAILDSLHLQKDSLPYAEEARAFIRESIRGNPITALTRIIYTPSGKDKVIHNYNTKEKYSLDEHIVGKDGFINPADNDALKAITGLGSSRLNEIYQWINNANCHIWRVNSKPESISERAVWFDADSGRVSLYCYRSPDDLYFSFGVRRSQKN